MPKQPALNLLVIVGPTGSGKSSLAIALAQTLDAEIISADSRYLYRELNVGTAKPSAEELAMVPHHLVNVATLAEPWSLGVYQSQARQLITEINQRGKLPILVGGTGQYIRSIVQNWEVPAQEAVEKLRDGIETWGNEIGFEALHHKLSQLDPVAASKIDYRNKRRTIRAWEVIFSTGDRFSQQRTKSACPYKLLTIGLEWPRDMLYARIDQRLEEMLAQGLLDEVRSLRAQGYQEALERMRVIGYTEINAYLEGQISFDEALRLIRKNTRVFVRRQANWFKPDDPSISWLNAKDPALLESALDLVGTFFVD